MHRGGRAHRSGLPRRHAARGRLSYRYRRLVSGFGATVEVDTEGCQSIKLRQRDEYAQFDVRPAVRSGKKADPMPLKDFSLC